MVGDMDLLWINVACIFINVSITALNIKLYTECEFL